MRTCSRIGLAHYFERSLNARQVGALKPDPLLFHKVIEGTDLKPQQVVYVGDDPALDVVGARAAGMHAGLDQSPGARWSAGRTSATRLCGADSA